MTVPRKGPAKRQRLLFTHVTDSELEAITSAAHAAGKRIEDWIRELALAAARVTATEGKS